MVPVKSVKTKLMSIMAVVSVLTLATAAYGTYVIDRVARTTDAMLNQYFPWSRCAEQALLAVAQGSDCVKASPASRFTRLERLRNCGDKSHKLSKATQSL